MSTITKDQIIKIHAKLNEIGLMEEKKQLVLQYTEFRTDSTKGMKFEEARRLIASLEANDPGDRMRKKIIALFRNMGLAYGNKPEDHKMNMAVIDQFMVKRSYLKKRLASYKYNELPKLVSQIELIADKAQQAALINELKSELGLK
jgi:hypothetical protein